MNLCTTHQKKKNHSEYLGSCEKMTKAEALEKARKKKAEDLGIRDDQNRSANIKQGKQRRSRHYGV